MAWKVLFGRKPVKVLTRRERLLRTLEDPNTAKNVTTIGTTLIIMVKVIAGVVMAIAAALGFASIKK